jgi:hypothetical protein
MEDDRNNLTVKKEHTVAAINILTAKQGHPPLSNVQINMVQEMVLNHNRLNQLATGKYIKDGQVVFYKSLVLITTEN